MSDLSDAGLTHDFTSMNTPPCSIMPLMLSPVIESNFACGTASMSADKSANSSIASISMPYAIEIVRVGRRVVNDGLCTEFA